MENVQKIMNKFFCGVTVWLRRIWLTVVLQAIRVLRNGEYAPYIVFIAAPTIATLQEVHRVSAPLYQCCLCLSIQWPPGLSIFFNSNSCFEANLRVSSFKILAAVEIFLEKVGTNKFYLNLFRVFFYSRIEIYSAQGILYFSILHVYTLLFSVALYVYICYYFSFWTTAWHFLVFHIIWIFRHWKFYALLITHPM